MRFYYLILIFILSFAVNAQEETGFAMDEIDPDLGLKNLVKPGVINKSRSKGVEISYLHTNGSFFESELNEDDGDGFSVFNSSSTRRIQYYSFKLKFPMLLLDKIKIIGGYDLKPTAIRFSSIGDIQAGQFQRLNDRVLKSSSFSLTVTRPWNEKTYSAFQIKTSFRGDYKGILNTNARFVTYDAITVFGVKVNDYTEYGVGIAFRHNVRRTLVAPFFMYNKTYNKNWGLEIVLPTKIMGRYNVGPDDIILFGIEYHGATYSIDVYDEFAETFLSQYFSQSAIRAQFNVQKKLVPWVWLDMKFGYQKNFNTTFDARVFGGQRLQWEASDPLFFKFGVFVSPPDDKM